MFVGEQEGLISINDLVAEMPQGSVNYWAAALARRILAVSTGMSAISPIAEDLAERFESARCPLVGKEANALQASKDHWLTLPALCRLDVGWGNPHPRLVLVGERDTAANVPAFTSRTGTRLFLALRNLGYDELSFYLTNVKTARGASRLGEMADLHAILAEFEPTWIAFGKATHLALEAANIPHLQVVHPSWHIKFRSSAGPRGFANLMTEAGLREGPWMHRQLPMRKIQELPKMAHPLDFRLLYVPGQEGAEWQPGVATNNYRTRNDHSTEKVRRIYVSGQSKTIGEAMAKVKVKDGAIHCRAKAEGWREERAEHAKRKTRAFLASDIEDEVAYAKQLRALAWDAALRAMEITVANLSEDGATISPIATKQLTETALALSAANVGESSEAKEALNELSLSDLLKDARERLDALSGAT